MLAGNISSQIPDKFTVEPFDYEGTEIQSAVLGSVRLVELADGEECGLYIFDKETKLFEKYISYTSSSTVYTVLSTTDKDVSMLEKTSVSLDENTEITAWLAPQVGEGYYIISVLNNENGEKYLALYCTEDKSIQKLSDKILGSVPASAETEIEQTDKNNKFSISKDIIKNIVIVFCSLVIVAGITVIIIVIIKNTKKKKRQHDWYDESDPYDVNIEEENIEIYTGHDSDFE